MLIKQIIIHCGSLSCEILGGLLLYISAGSLQFLLPPLQSWQSSCERRGGWTATDEPWSLMIIITQESFDKIWNSFENHTKRTCLYYTDLRKFELQTKWASLTSKYKEYWKPQFQKYTFKTFFFSNWNYIFRSISTAGNPVPWSVTPFFARPFSDSMSLLERVQNTGYFAILGAMHALSTKVFVQAVVRRHLGASVPDVLDLASNVSFIVQMGHHSVTYPRPFLPNVMEAGCLHCRPPRSLPKVGAQGTCGPRAFSRAQEKA